MLACSIVSVILLLHCYMPDLYVIMELSFPRTFVPTSESSIGGTFAPWNFRSMELSLPGTFVPWNFRPLELSLPRAKMTWNFRSPTRIIISDLYRL